MDKISINKCRARELCGVANHTACIEAHDHLALNDECVTVIISDPCMVCSQVYLPFCAFLLYRSVVYMSLLHKSTQLVGLSIDEYSQLVHAKVISCYKIPSVR